MSFALGTSPRSLSCRARRCANCRGRIPLDPIQSQLGLRKDNADILGAMIQVMRNPPA